MECPENARKAIQWMEPYRGAENYFWMLHKLNNINKHRTLLTVGFATTGASGPVDLMKKTQFSYDAPLEKGSRIVRTLADVQGHFQTQFWFDVAVHELDADCPAFALIDATWAWQTLASDTARSLSSFR